MVNEGNVKDGLVPEVRVIQALILKGTHLNVLGAKKQRKGREVSEVNL